MIDRSGIGENEKKDDEKINICPFDFLGKLKCFQPSSCQNANISITGSCLRCHGRLLKNDKTQIPTFNISRGYFELLVSSTGSLGREEGGGRQEKVKRWLTK